MSDSSEQRAVRRRAQSSGKSKPEAIERLEIYKLAVEMADRVSQRRQTANSFYTTVNTLLLGTSAYWAMQAPLYTILVISTAGVLVCIYWIQSIQSYKTLNTAKYNVITDIELNLSVKPFTNEWKELDPDGDGVRHKPFHQTERVVPKIFLAIYVAQILISIPWSEIAGRVLFSACYWKYM